MTRRPDPFDQAALEEALRVLGCPESFIPSTISNYRLFVPLLFAQLDEDYVFRTICEARHDLGLGEQQSAWRSAVRYLKAWADSELDAYKTRRGVELTLAESDLDDCRQPRLL